MRLSARLGRRQTNLLLAGAWKVDMHPEIPFSASMSRARHDRIDLRERYERMGLRVLDIRFASLLSERTCTHRDIVRTVYPNRASRRADDGS